jgi:Ca2+-binding RTX toxin-like protein
MVGVTRIGGDVQVNTDALDYPFGNAPTIVKMAGGGYMVMWSETNNNRNGSGSGDIRAEIFNAAGAKVGSEFIVNTTLTGAQGLSTATLLADGTIFVAWQDGSLTGGDASSLGIKGQLLSATGTKVGGEFLVNTTTTGAQGSPQISALSNGNVLIVWGDQSQTGEDTSSGAVRAQIMTPTGTKVGGEFLVNTTTTGSQGGAKIAALAGGNVIVTWTDASALGTDTSGNSIKGQLLDSSGAKVGGEFLVNTNTAGNQTASNITALATGGFVVTWQDASGTLGDPSSTSIKAQIFDAAGQKVGTEFLVNTVTDGPQQTPAITTLDNGDFVIAWQDQLMGTPGRQDLRGQLFSPAGVKIGAEFVADAPLTNIIEGAPAILAIGDGKFVIASGSSLFTDTGQGVVQTTRGEHLQVFAGSRELSGTVGADQLVAAAGADTIYASPGHDTIDGRGGTDRVIVNADDRSLFALTTGSATYTLANNVLTNSLGTLDTTLTSVERVEIFDRSSANHTYTDSVGGFRYFHFGSGDDVINSGGIIEADLGLGNNRIDGLAGGHDFVLLYVDSSSSPVSVADSAGGITVSYATATGQSSTQVTNYESYGLQAIDGQGLRADTSNSLANINLVDSPYDDMLIGGRGDNVFESFSGANQVDLSKGTDYKIGNGGADTYDYSVAIPTTSGDHIMDLDSDDILDFSYYQDATIRFGPNPSFIGTAAFTNVERQIRYEKTDGKTYIYTDVNGDGTADGTVVIEDGAFDLALTTNANGGETVLKIALAQNFVNGTSSGESLSGTAGADVIRGYAGDDIIRASAGQDFVDGGAGFDVLNVTMGDASIFTAPGAARSYTIGSDRMIDSSGVLNTSFLGLESINLSTIGAGNFGDTTDAHAFGGVLNATLGTGQDIVIGTAQGDSIDGGGGVDKLYGGLGNDTYYTDQQGDLVFENAGEGTDTIVSTANFYLYANIEDLTLAAGAGNIFGVGNELANTLTGNEGNNTLLAGGDADVVHAGAGVDIVYGEAGDDLLYGDAGNDFLAGGIGNDTIDGGAGGDSVYGEAGNDILYGGSTFEFDILVGGDGNDVLHGDSGLGDYDYLYGNAGDDAFYVDTGDDLTFENAGEGTDTVYANVAGANNGVYLYANVENLVLLGTTTFGVGNELANTMTGNASGNYLLGGAGDDVLNGKAGGDVLFGEAGADRFVFEHGTGGDVIGDFQVGVDKIDLTAIGYTWQQVQNSLHENGGNTAIDLGGGDLVVLNGVTAAHLQASDFILASGSGATTVQGVGNFQLALDGGGSDTGHPALSAVWALDGANDNGLSGAHLVEMLPLEGNVIAI